MSEIIRQRDPLPSDMETIRGAKLADVAELRATLLREVYSKNSIRPYFKFGDLPIPFVTGQTAHMLCIGDSGAAKTTTLRTLMSYLMPLASHTADNLLAIPAAQRAPSSPQEFSRSLTFQAVVYDAKVENVPFLAALGFKPSRDLIILDPADERCFAWDIAKDFNSRDDIDHLLNLLIPSRAESHRENASADFFEASARLLIQDIIVSFRNAALAQSRQPAWTLRDILNAIARPDCLRYLFQWHDTPAEAVARLDIYPATFDGILATARSLINPFRQAAERWDEATRLGRRISFKDWILRGRNTVLVLPNTESNVLVNGPLNRLMLRALTELVLRNDHSFVYDENNQKHVRRRYFFFDELGDAGKLPTLKRLLTEGREFGANVVLGLHAISQLEHTYGKEDANTILALCPFKALLRAGDSATAEWMAKFVGDSLRAYRKMTLTAGSTSGQTWSTQESQTDGASDGTTVTGSQSTSHAKSRSDADTRSYQVDSFGRGRLASTSKQNSHGITTTESQSISLAQSHQDSRSNSTGTSQGSSSSSSHSQSDSVDLRQENALYYSEFMKFPDPAKTRIVRVVCHVPFLGTWQTDISLDLMLSQLEKPQASSPQFQKWQDDDRVSRAKAWTPDDFSRLGIAPLPISAPPRRKAIAPPNTSLLAAPNAIAPADQVECNDECGLPPPNFDF